MKVGVGWRPRYASTRHVKHIKQTVFSMTKAFFALQCENNKAYMTPFRTQDRKDVIIASFTADSEFGRLDRSFYFLSIEVRSHRNAVACFLYE